MAHGNINERREFVKQQLGAGLSDKEIKKQGINLFNCSSSAIHADLIFFRNHDPAKTYHLSSAIRAVIYERDGKACQYCGAQDERHYIIEHIIPAALGGKAETHNLTVACQKCNLQKGRQIWAPRNLLAITISHIDFRIYILQTATKLFL